MSATTSTSNACFSDLLEILPDGTPRVLKNVHHLQELLQMDAEEVLARFKRDQVAVATSPTGDRISGAGYVTGWINKDHTCFGELWIVSFGSESPEVYQWQAIEPRKM